MDAQYVLASISRAAICSSAETCVAGSTTLSAGTHAQCRSVCRAAQQSKAPRRVNPSGDEHEVEQEHDRKEQQQPVEQPRHQQRARAHRPQQWPRRVLVLRYLTCGYRRRRCSRRSCHRRRKLHRCARRTPCGPRLCGVITTQLVTAECAAPPPRRRRLHLAGPLRAGAPCSRPGCWSETGSLHRLRSPPSCSRSCCSTEAGHLHHLVRDHDRHRAQRARVVAEAATTAGAGMGVATAFRRVRERRQNGDPCQNHLATCN